MDHLNNFMKNCIDSGKTSISDITFAAKNRILEIESKISEIEELKKEEKTLKSLIKQLGADFQKEESVSFESSVAFNALDLKIQNISLNIIELFNSIDESSVKDIINTISSLEESKFILTSLKWLIDNKILCRNEQDRKIYKGQLWLEKEKLLSTINLKD